VTSAGGREHFVVLVSPSRVAVVDDLLKSLPPPVSDAPIANPQLPKSVVSHLRGVGGLVLRPSSGSGSQAHFLFETAGQLGSAVESATGVWARQLTLNNLGR
jgi:hypothetical protein